MQIKANGIFLEVQEHGPKTGPALVLIRGLSTQLIHWPANFIQGFVDAGFRTVVFDNRDIGLSQRCPKPGVPDTADAITAAVASGAPIPFAYTLSDMAADVIGMMDALGIDKAHVFGISMGGAIAQTLAIEHSDRLLSDTIVMTAARKIADADVMEDLLPRILSYPETLQQAQDNRVAEDAFNGSPGYPQSEDELRTMARLAFERGSLADGINRQLLAVLSSDDKIEDLSKVNLPCLVIHGQDDALVPVELGAEIAASIPKSEYHAIKGMGHTISASLAPQIIDLVTEFIARRT